MACRDYRSPRPALSMVHCPSCDTAYPLGLIAGLGEVRCGHCGSPFHLRSGMGVSPAHERAPVLRKPVPEAESPPAPRLPKPYRRDDSGPKRSTSVRTSEASLEEWRATAAKNGETFNGWMRRQLDEAVALDRALERSHIEHP